jgi:zinc protease
MTLNRTIAPLAHSIQQVNILPAEKYLLDNQIPVYAILAGEQPVVRLELIFEAGGKYETVQGASQFTAKMLSEGTSQHSAAEISEAFDQFGAFMDISQNADRINISVHCLTKHLPEILPTLQEMLQDSIFPEKELQTIKNITLQTLKVNLEKTSFVAGQVLRENLFGKTHPYGRAMSEANILIINQLALKSFYKNHIKNKPFKIFISGKFGENEIESLNQVFGQTQVLLPQKSTKKTNPETIDSTSILIEKTGSVQSTIRIGKVLFGRKNPDFFKFLITNTLLGGFFGSRLMKNIREDKGYTYGISSSLVQQLDAAFFIIGTDVKREFTSQTIDEIHKEIKRLQTELVSDNELNVAKNYMIGAFAGSLNTPFEVADRQKIIILDELPSGFYDNYINQIRAVSAEEVQLMAAKYLIINELSEVIIGGK